MNKIHFSLDKKTYLSHVQSGYYKADWENLSFRDIPKDFEVFHDYMTRVGHKWGWNEMTDRFGQAAMNPKLSHSETILRELLSGEDVIGYSLTLSPSQKLKNRFWQAANKHKVIEIENLGLFPKECGQGRGWAFFEMHFQDLFQRYDTVYWSMSSTNHPHLQAYYERKGMRLLGLDYMLENA